MKKFYRLRRARGGFVPAIPKRYGSGRSDFYERAKKYYRFADNYTKKYTGQSIGRHASRYVHDLMEKYSLNEGKKTNVQTKKKRKTPVGAPPISTKPPVFTPTPPWSPRGKARMNQRVRPVGVGSSFSRYVFYKKAGWMKRIYKNLSPVQRYSSLSSTRIYTNYNTQNYTAVMAYTLSHITNLCALVASEGGSTTPTAQPVPGYKFIMQSCKAEHTFTNATNANAYLKIYEIVCRRETTTDPVSAYNLGFALEASGASTSVGRTALTLNYGAGTIGATPFQSSYFCSRYKIVKVASVELAGGKSHVHVSNYIPNKYYSQEELDSPVSSETDVYQAYMTRGILVVSHGSPTDDDSSVSAPVGMSTVGIDMVTRLTYTYRYMKPQRINYIYNDALPVLTAQHIQSDVADELVQTA